MYTFNSNFIHNIISLYYNIYLHNCIYNNNNNILGLVKTSSKKRQNSGYCICNNKYEGVMIECCSGVKCNGWVRYYIYYTY